MAYADFNLERAQRSLGLDLVEKDDLFLGIPEQQPSPLLRAILDENIPLARAINTEKARSEFLVAPILSEVRKALGHRISLFSGVDFEVARDRGLNGVADFLLAGSPNQWVLSNPVLVVIEAKNDNIKSGIGQCIATMYAAREFNSERGEFGRIIHGAVTTGTLWQFLRLDGQTILVDGKEYYIDQVEKILGILIWAMTAEDRDRRVA